MLISGSIICVNPIVPDEPDKPGQEEPDELEPDEQDEPDKQDEPNEPGEPKDAEINNKYPLPQAERHSRRTAAQKRLDY